MFKRDQIKKIRREGLSSYKLYLIYSQCEIPLSKALEELKIILSNYEVIAYFLVREKRTEGLSLTTEINNIGGKATELPDGIAIEPSVNLHGGLWHTYEDHRMATAGAIIGLKVPGIEIEDINVVTKTMPNFVELWSELLEHKA